ncbi:ribonuclease H-like domain-containing protein [Sporosarcina pasteurii]|uniref:Predicted exonuclease n=1 Tax=Sporosarcina pasteurii TaxID=1474 RepID=A0A380BKZ1_SPOPA|nr:ribonuclease H-like domain-containing protein [Sporosarcina pasteurii]MDS9470856.1 ribonuclease H-like domain-containing protein [Sporosarcina pasteurii]QBQ05477.1 exonuclease [Sporosarcina pasteurii]SUJ02909.1 Predicted exonuclease [Sporosarcina pasteurii]
MSYEQKLMAMKKMLTKKPKPTKKTKRDPVIPPAPPYEKNWLKTGLIKEENQFGVVYKRIVEYDETYYHGNKKIGDLQSTLEKWKRFDREHPLAPKGTNKLVFFDTETTGLKGAGTLIFLLGFMEQVENGFRMTQYVLPGPDHEAAFLYASKLWKEEMTLITYNGKSFDLPQVETRWTMNRQKLPKLLTHHQIDLLHGARRVWKAELDTFKLTSIEEKQLHFYREGDIPGHLAPIIYQDAVKSGQAETLMKVLKHNEWDILSLVTLYIRATNLILETTIPETAITHTNIGKWFADLKHYDDSAYFFKEVIEKYGSDHAMSHYHYGFILKRNEAYDKAVQSFNIAAKQLGGRERIIALEEVAKLQEHKLKNLAAALEVTRNAMSFIDKDSELTKRFRTRAERDFLKREMRLIRKIFPGEAQKTTKAD